jgi:hypothetical protein
VYIKVGTVIILQNFSCIVFYAFNLNLNRVVPQHSLISTSRNGHIIFVAVGDIVPDVIKVANVLDVSFVP